MKNISIGIMLGVVMCMIILTYYPLSETEQACSNCGMKSWYFQLAKGEE